jgi:hypothetical protein
MRRFVSFDKNLNIIAEDIDNSARYIYDDKQKYFIKGNPTEDIAQTLITLKEFHDTDISKYRKNKN